MATVAGLCCERPEDRGGSVTCANYDETMSSRVGGHEDDSHPTTLNDLCTKNGRTGPRSSLPTTEIDPADEATVAGLCCEDAVVEDGPLLSTCDRYDDAMRS